MTYWDKLRVVVDYLNGTTDIYDGKHADILEAWNSAWSEMVFQGFNPQTINGIKKYIEYNK